MQVQASASKMAFEAPFVRPVVSIAKVMQTEADESAILARLSARQRWMYIARHHPIDFAVSVTTVFIAIYILIYYVLRLIPKVVSLNFVPSAFAEGTSSAQVVSGIDLRVAAFIVMAIPLLWAMAVASWGKSPAKITWAKELVKFAQGFLAGIVTGGAK